MIKNKLLLFWLISTSVGIYSMGSQPFSQGCNLNKPLEYCNHALREMVRRNITKENITETLFSTNLIEKQKYGRITFTQGGGNLNPLRIVLIMTQTKNVVVTAFRQHQNPRQITLNERFQNIRNQKRKLADR